MGLSLTVASAPQLGLEALDEACRGRGLDGVELVASARPEENPEALADTAGASGIRVTALRAEEVTPSLLASLARAASRLGVPVSVPADALAGADLRAEAAGIFARENARLYLSHGTELETVLYLISTLQSEKLTPTLGLAWELRPSSESLEEAGAVIFSARDHLGVVRLFGGGPEQQSQDGSGVGSVLVDLALAQYSGPVVLCPSREAELPRWSAWLSSRRPAGCGSGKSSGDVVLDVRPVEPRDRLDTIMSAYHGLLPGSKLHLTVDHDPSCMYHMLDATEPAGSFQFKKLEDGPVVWKAEVTRL